MAEPLAPRMQELASNLVQEIAKSNEQIPEKFLHKDGFPDAIDDPDLWKHRLLIDLSVLNSSTPDARNELAKLQSALSLWGCFQVVNHGIENTFLEEMVEVTKQFFRLPVEEKLKCSDADEIVLGYGKGTFSTGAQAENWNDGLYLVIYPQVQRTLQFYPRKPEKFSGMIHEYSEKLAAVAEATYKAMSLSLNLDEECLLSYIGKKTIIKARFINYPKCPCPDRVLGVKPHSDGTYMTILLPDNQVDGLQVRKAEQWYKVPIIPGALFINLGDLGELVNHGVACSLMDRLHSAGKEFFALPIEEKKKYSRTLECFEGYGSDVASPDWPINWNDRLYLKIHPPEQRNLKLWPENVPNFRETLDEYSIGMWKVLETMLKAIAKSINLDENAFLNQYGEDGSFLARFNYYPPCPYPDQVVGLGPHSDGTLITILLQDKDVEGLQILRDDQWYKVPVIPGALCINIGDQLEIMSNGILKSPIHKAVTNTEKARLSVSVPTSVHDDKEIGPLSELIDESRPKLYKNVDNYLGSLLESYARGVRPLNAAKIQQ